MPKEIFHIFIPLILSNVLHMIIVKNNILPQYSIPISAPLFGKNKTWRGMILLPLINGVFFYLINLAYPLFDTTNSILYGMILGFTYMAFELPNSMFKRQLGIPAGERSEKYPILISLMDKSDSALGVSLVSKFLFNFTWKETAMLCILSIIVHTLFSLLLVWTGVKSRL